MTNAIDNPGGARNPVSGHGNAHDDHWIASAFRLTAGVVTVVAGVAGLLTSIWIWAIGSDLPSPLDSLLPDVILSKIAFSFLSIGASLGGILWLRGAHAGVPLCSGTWAAAAALAARPGVTMNYAGGLSPTIQIPAEGRSPVVIAIFIGAAVLAVLTHGFSGVTRHSTAKLSSTTGEAIVSAILLIGGLVAAIQFQIDSNALGSVVVEKALLPFMIATVVLQGLGLAVLAGFAIARAGAIVILLALAAAVFFPDLLFDRVHMPVPAFWSGACIAGAASLLLPRRHHAHPQHA
ncbi:MAG: hypothetical protein HY286_08775 [Planctomycetes bacterium]|nr:hypothetical protein [Planctomycetota bacterium]